MKILYIFPHPDDESFGPVAAMHRQLKDDHEVYLLTLTKGEATKQRFKLNLSKAEMGEVRYREMQAVASVLGLTGMEVLDLPDGQLNEMDPRDIEKVIQRSIDDIKPDILVSYPVHGISGFHDHLVTHAVVKRVYLEMKENGADYLKRLSFFTLPDNEQPVFQGNQIRLKHTHPSRIDCVMHLETEDIEMFKKCLSCYETYKETIEESKVVEKIGDTIYFEFFGEHLDTPIDDITVFY